jgi:hypothetical protein
MLAAHCHPMTVTDGPLVAWAIWRKPPVRRPVESDSRAMKPDSIASDQHEQAHGIHLEALQDGRA